MKEPSKKSFIKNDKPTIMDKIDKNLTKVHLMNPLVQFDRYLHRHNIDHTHPTKNLIIRKSLQKVEGGSS